MSGYYLSLTSVLNKIYFKDPNNPLSGVGLALFASIMSRQATKPSHYPALLTLIKQGDLSEIFKKDVHYTIGGEYGDFNDNVVITSLGQAFLNVSENRVLMLTECLNFYEKQTTSAEFEAPNEMVDRLKLAIEYEKAAFPDKES